MESHLAALAYATDPPSDALGCAKGPRVTYSVVQNVKQRLVLRVGSSKMAEVARHLLH
jgi:hypothetical protein